MSQPYDVPGNITPRRSSSPLTIILAVIGSCLVVFVLIAAGLYALFVNGFQGSRDHVGKVACMSNMKQLSLGLLMYVQDYDERYPPKESWGPNLMPYIKNTQVYTCPSDQSMPNGYAYNAKLHQRFSKDIKNPASMPALYESTLHLPSGSDLLESWAPRHKGYGNVGYVDGHVKAMQSPPPADAGLK